MENDMAIHDDFGLTRVINAAGTFTPLGVSRSSERVGQVVAAALSEFFIIDELQKVLSEAIAEQTGAEAGAATHCVAAGITLSVAAAMAGDAPEGVSALPDSTGLPNRVVLPMGHAVNYGHPILTDIRLAGAVPVTAGTEQACTAADLELALAHEDTACLLLVSSRLAKGQSIDLTEAVAAAHRRGVPAIIDGAAQDMRIKDLLATDADLVLVSAHKYMASPTAGLIIGRKKYVQACRAHERGIGRAMKPTKEAILGVLAALHERHELDQNAWRAEQARKVDIFLSKANRIPGIRAQELPDPVGMPFSRVLLQVVQNQTDGSADALVAALKEGSPSIRVMEYAVAEGALIFELVPLTDEELAIVLDRISVITSSWSSRLTVKSI
jgi:uncharacterized pyridoxal phosphate-dependent enzyme